MRRSSYCIVGSMLVLFGAFPAAAQTSWSRVNPLPQGKSLRGVCASGGGRVAVGDAGAIISSDDGGMTWQERGCAYSKLNGVGRIDASTVIAVGEGVSSMHEASPVVLKSYDAGVTWQMLAAPEEPVPGYGFYLEAVSFPSDSVGYVVGAGYTFRSTDAGVTWAALSGNAGYDVGGSGLHTVHFSSEKFGLVAGHRGQILCTSDGGDTWKPREYPELEGIFNGSWCLDSLRMFVVGYAYEDLRPPGVVFASSDGGLSWNSVQIPDVPRLTSLSFASSSVGVAVGDGGVILRTVDGGGAWQQMTSPTTQDLKSVIFSDSLSGVAVGAQGVILTTGDGGESWMQRSSAITNESLHSIHGVGPLSATAVGTRGTILRTALAGRDWVQQVSGTTRALLDVQFRTLEEGMAVGDSGTVLRTTDAGTSWESMASGTTASLSGVCWLDAKQVTAAGSGGTIIHSADAGGTWTARTSSVGEGLEDIHFADSLVGSAVGGAGTILRTSDGGANWVKQTSGVDNRLNAVWLCGRDTGTVVGEGIILRTEDGGQTWRVQYVHAYPWDPLGAALCRDVTFSNSQHGFVTGWMSAGYGRGFIWETTDGGETWDRIHCLSGSLLGVQVVNEGTTIVTGDGGTILRQAPDSHFVTIDSAGASLIAEDIARLEWRTSAESLLCVFEVERTYPGNGEFHPIPRASIPAHGTTTIPRSYGFTDSTDVQPGTVYRLRHIGYGGTVGYSEPIAVTPVVEVAARRMPGAFELAQNYPNPFNPSTTIRYGLPQRSHVTLTLFNMMGQQVAMLVQGELEAGYHEAVFDASGLASGVYLYRLQAGEFVETRKLVLMH